jgi:hypothetical protein
MTVDVHRTTDTAKDGYTRAAARERTAARAAEAIIAKGGVPVSAEDVEGDYVAPSPEAAARARAAFREAHAARASLAGG